MASMSTTPPTSWRAIDALVEHGQVPVNGTTLHYVQAGPRAASPLVLLHGFPESWIMRSEEHTSELQSHSDLVCRLLLEKKKLIVAFRQEIRFVCRPGSHLISQCFSHST